MIKNSIIQFALFKMNNLHIVLIHNVLYTQSASKIFQDVARNVSTIEYLNHCVRSRLKRDPTLKRL